MGMLGKKHSEATRKMMSLARLGEKNPNYGRIFTPEHRRRLSNAHIGQQKGKLNNRWKGGITFWVYKVRESFKYRQWRSDVYQRDSYTCQECGQRGGDLEAHHIKQFTKIIEENCIKDLETALACEELWNLNNGQTLCVRCHNKTKIGRKK